MTGFILTVNVGSSSIRVATYRTNGAEVEPVPVASRDVAKPEDCFESALEFSAIAHRVVHAGAVEEDATLISDGVIDRIREGVVLAPNHNQKVLDIIQAARERFETIPQVAVYDSAFHRRIPLPAALYAVPYEWYERFSIKRLGFHGLSHRYASNRSAEILGHLPARVVTAHIGNGASLAAVLDGTSVDTTMGFTPLEGLMMGRRSGSVDPGIILYLMQKEALSASEMERLVSAESGLLGVSGKSGDFRDVLSSRAVRDPRASLAFDMYVHRLRRGIGEMVATLNGIDALVFTGGVGEHSPELRSAVCSGLSSFGIGIDDSKNAAVSKDEMISPAGNSVPVLVVSAKENLMMARASAALVDSRHPALR